MLATIKATAATVGFFSATATAYVSFMTKEMERQQAKLQKDNPGAEVTFGYRYAPNSGGIFEPIIKKAPESPVDAFRPK